MKSEPTLDTTNLEAFRHAAEDLAGRLPGLLVQAERIARTIEQGVHGRRRAGVGETFWQFRPYEPGEDAKRIDWRQSAKSADLYVREQEWEAAQSVWLGCDLSPSMVFSSSAGLPKKSERAILMTLSVAMALVRGGERVALLGSAGRPAAGKFAIDRLCEDLVIQVRGGMALERTRSIPGAANVVLVSDFLEPLEDIQLRVQGLASRAVRGVALHLVDPAEASFPYRGRVLFNGLEGEGEVLIRHAGQIRERYIDLFDAHRQSVRSLLSHCGWVAHLHDTSQSPETAILAVYQSLAPKLAA